MAEPLSSPAPGSSPARRFGLRFGFSYFLIYSLEILFRVVPLGWRIQEAYPGSGDRTSDYRRVLWGLALAALAALVGTGLDRYQRHPRPQDARRDRGLDESFRICLRSALALLLLSYGMSKVIPAEFPFPSIDRLQERIGDSSPFALYSVFMGYSAPYTFFTGVSALGAALLLLFRRTTTLGALVVLGVLGNEAMLAFSYDVPTKLLSLHGLGMALLLLAPDLGRLVDGLLLDRPTRPANLTSPFAEGEGRLVGRWLPALPALPAGIAAVALVSTALQNLEVVRERRQAPRPPLYGAYDVEQFLKNGQAAPDPRDRSRWQRLIVTSPRQLTVSLADGSRRSFATEYSGESVRLREGTLAYSRPDPDHLLLQGTLGGDSLRLALRRIDGSKYLLVSRKLHVIDDEPLNQ